MARQKKNKQLHSEHNQEVKMSETAVLEPVEVQTESLQTELDLIRIELEKAKIELEEKKAQMKSMPAREISEEEKRIIAKQVNMVSDKGGLLNKIEKMKAADSVMITGKFINRRSPGKQCERLTYLKHSTDPVKWYDFCDGQIYTIPTGFANQLNGGTDEDPCYYQPKFNQVAPDADGKGGSAIHSVDTSNKKYAFVPLNF